MIASEFDTLAELQDDIRERLGRARLMERGQQAREKLHDQLLDAVDIPMPEGIINAEVDQHFEDHGDYDEGHREEVAADARKGLKSQFILDAIADAEELSVAEAELTQWLLMQAPRYGMSPDQFAQALVEAGQVSMAVADVRRGKALAVVLKDAVITDTDGNTVDLSELDRPEGDDPTDADLEALEEEAVVVEAEEIAEEAADVEAAAEEAVVAEAEEITDEAAEGDSPAK